MAAAPDLGTWLQCFAIYTAVVLTKFPERATSLIMLYAANIAKLSQKFRWPSWVIYDNSFRQEAAEARHTDWTKIDGSLHAQCFHGMSITSESWCTLCHSVDQLPPKAPRPATHQTVCPTTDTSGGAKRFREAATPICGSYNKNNGDCSFMPRCNYRHVYRRCHGPAQMWKSFCPRASPLNCPTGCYRTSSPHSTMTDFVIAIMLSYLIMLTVALHLGPKAVGQPEPHLQITSPIMNFILLLTFYHLFIRAWALVRAIHIYNNYACYNLRG